MKWLIAIAALSACGDDSSTTPVDATTTSDTSTSIDAPPGRREALVFVVENRNPNGSSSNATASFAVGRLFGGPASSAGGCDSYPSQPEGGESAGDIAVSGTTTPVTIVPSGTAPNVTYDAAAPEPADLFTPGANISFGAAGATVPAFTGSVTAPDAIAGEVLPAMLSRAAPPTVTWTGGTGEVWFWMVSIDTGSGGGGEHLVWCRTTDTGTYAIPAAAMGFVPVTHNLALVTLWRIAKSEVSVGAWDVTVIAGDAVSDFASIVP